MDARTETVIIPHLNEQAAQRRRLCALQEQADGALWIPLYPSYLRVLPEDAAVTSCVLTRLRADWTVDESRWVKAKRCETEAEVL